jgi:hypothetical protein
MLAHTRYIAHGSGDFFDEVDAEMAEYDSEGEEQEEDVDDAEPLEIWLAALIKTAEAEKVQMDIVEGGSSV